MGIAAPRARRNPSGVGADAFRPTMRGPMKDLMSRAAIDRWLGDTTGLERDEDALAKGSRSPRFAAAIAFVSRVAGLAEEAEHHPDIDVRYDRVRLRLSSHDAGGVTERDVTLAENIERAAATR